ncbi:alpha/beta fold hydrolase [Nocardia tengchongensis]
MRAQPRPLLEPRTIVDALRFRYARAARHERYEPVLPAGRTVELPGRGPIFVRSADGPAGAVPVVLLHGWTWTADLNFADVFRTLSAHHPVIAPDLRGHGGGIRADGPFRAADATDDVIALLDALGIEKAIFCGYSMGGVLTADALHRHPGRVAGVVVQAAALSYSGTRRSRRLWRSLAALRPLARLGLGPAVGAWYLSGSVRDNPGMARRWDWIRAQLHRTSPRDVLAVIAELAGSDLRPRTRPARCPGEVLVTTADRVCLPAWQRDLAARFALPVVEYDSDHDLPIADPGSYARLTLQSIRRVAAAAAAAS